MAVSRLEEYRQKDGTDILKVILKSTPTFPNSCYFYTDAENIDLVMEDKSWHWNEGSCKNIYIASVYSKEHKSTLFHRRLAFKYLGYYPKCLDHINRVALDNIDMNLNVVTTQQNAFNYPCRGYTLIQNSFSPSIKLAGTSLSPCGFLNNEKKACILQNWLEQAYLKCIMQDQHYMYNFLKDRHNDLDILDLERTGKISSDEATYRHVMRYAKDNAWYYYRYNLKEYFKDNHIPVPDFSLDEQGFMRHSITNELLCPFQ